MGKLIDLTGQKFNMLTVLRRAPKNDSQGRAMWECQCDCGNYTTVKGTAIRKGETKSCGCLQRIKTREVNTKDITNERFGYLVALKPTDERDAGAVVWECQCDCGKRYYVRSTALRSHHTLSCGCMTESKGELAIKNILNANQISFKQETIFSSCRFPSTNGIVRFDFYVNNEYIIEFDGKQHFQDTGGFFTTSRVEEIQLHDEYKTQWCKENNIPLIRIPYTHLEHINIKDLLLETTTFRTV